MAAAFNDEGFGLKRPCMERTVHKGIEIRCNPPISSRIERQMHAPVIRCSHVNVVR